MMKVLKNCTHNKNNMAKKLNLTQVAKILGVSIATVSNAFNRPDQLSSKLREKILAECERLGYRGPNLAARSLRIGASGVIGVVLVDSLSYSFSDPVASQLLQGVAELLVEKNKQMLLLSGNIDSAEQRTAESLPDGFIIYGAIRHSTLDPILRLGKPVVHVDCLIDSTHSVNIDNEIGSKTVANHAMQHMKKKGHDKPNISVLGLRMVDSKRICRLIESDFNSESREISQRRLKGYLMAAKENNMSIPFDRIWHIPENDQEHAEIAAREALASVPRPNILLCMSDINALAASRVCQEMGIRIPEDIVLTGFDDIPEASRAAPSLTTICQQSIEKGKVAANLLLEAIAKGDDEENIQHIMLGTRLIVRNSCP